MDSAQKLSLLFPRIEEYQARELVLILVNLATPDVTHFGSTAFGRDNVPLTLEMYQLVEELDKLNRDRQPVFNLLTKDVEPQILGYLDIKSLRAMRLVSKVTCDRVSGTLTKKHINFANLNRLERITTHLCDYYKNLSLPCVSIKISKVDSEKVPELFIQLMASLSANNKIREIKLDVSYNGLNTGEIWAISQVSTITELDLSLNSLGPLEAQIISGMANLTSLKINRNNLGPAGADESFYLVY
jgi:hypothetical protein